MPIERLKPSSFFTEEKLNELKQVVPEAFADGKINWQTLREALGEHLEDYERDSEHFGLFWPGKRDARRLASIPSTGTLVPVKGEGINEDTTGNIFIEGENLEVLKILRKSYAGRIKMIYIDPPYNTGNDFVYDDNFTEPLEEYLRRTGQTDEEGRALTTNKKSDGRFHSKWLSMMYPRLKLARELLRDDGVIFISINDNELANLRIICNEIFGEENLLSLFVWRTDGNFDNQAKVKVCHEYILSYCMNLDVFPPPPIIDTNVPKESKLYKEEIRNTLVKNGPKNPVSDIKIPKGFPSDIENGIINKRTDSWPHYKNSAKFSKGLLTNEVVVSSGWSSKDLLLEFINNKLQPIYDNKGQETSFVISKTGAIELIKKRTENQSHVISVLMNLGNTQSTSNKLREDKIYFDYPKPVNLIKYLVQMNYGEDAIILDFFAGSSTMAQAIIELNIQDNKNRKYILVQLQEPCEDNSQAYNAGYKNISDIGKERIRYVIKSTDKEVKQKKKKEKDILPGIGESQIYPDLGFKVFKLTKSSFKQWENYHGEEIDVVEDLFSGQVTPLVDGWKEDQLFTEVLLLEGFPLDSVVKTCPQFKKNTVKEVSSTFCEHKLFICLDEKIYQDTIKDLALGGSDIFVCLDSAVNDETKARLSDKGLIKTI